MQLNINLLIRKKRYFCTNKNQIYNYLIHLYINIAKIINSYFLNIHLLHSIFKITGQKQSILKVTKVGKPITINWSIIFLMNNMNLNFF